MNDNTLYAGHQGIARAADQQLLYQWNKFKQMAKLPHGAFVGQCDERANGDKWVIAKAGATVPNRGKFARSADPVNFTNDLKKAYAKGDYFLTLDNTTGNAILADAYAEAAVGVYAQGSGSDHVGLVNRIMGNKAALAASGSDLVLELEYPWETAIEVGVDVKISPQEWNGIVAAVNAQPVVCWSPITPTANYYYWVKTQGTVLVYAAGAITKGDALTVTADGDVIPGDASDGQIVAIAKEAIADNNWGSAMLTIGLQ